MDRLWAPWRSAFVTKRRHRQCIFCRAISSRADRQHYVFHRTTHSIALLNIYPYNNGHVMVAPRRHMPDLTRCSEAALLDIWQLVNAVQQQLEQAVHPHGFNIGVNLGRVGGAGFPGHVHVHLVPRWRGDTNFMTTVSETKVVSESLDALYERLRGTTPQRRGNA